MKQKKPISHSFKALCQILIFSFFSPHLAMAAPQDNKYKFGGTGNNERQIFGQEVMGFDGGVAEFYYRSDKNDVLVPVYVMGSVNRPGLYHVPLKTDLLAVLTIAGGTSPEADNDEINVRDSKMEKTHNISMSDLLETSKKRTNFTMQGNEVIFVDKSKPIVSNNTMLVVGLLSGMAGLVLTGFILKKGVK